MSAQTLLDTLKALVDQATIPATSTDANTLEKIRLIGETAHYFGGYGAMSKIHNEFEKAGGDTFKLNRLWDGVGVWAA